MENKQIGPKRAKNGKNMCLRPIYNFCEKKNSEAEYDDDSNSV